MRSPAKRQTEHFTIHPKKGIKAEIRHIAQSEGLTPSRVGAAALEDWLARRSHIQHRGIFQPMIEHAIAKEIRPYSSRIAVLEVRTFFIVEQIRAMVYNILREQPGMTEDKLNAIMDGSKDDAKRNIGRTDPDLAPYLPLMEHWLEQGVREAR
jgi:hypothetical protein